MECPVTHAGGQRRALMVEIDKSVELERHVAKDEFAERYKKRRRRILISN